jgi:hypothetical protein
MVPQDLLKYFGILATSWVGGDLALELERVPASAVIEVVDEARHGFSDADRVSLYRLLAHDGRLEVYSRLKQSLARDNQLTALRQLAEYEDPEVQAVAVDALRMALNEAGVEERTALATSFALALSKGPRLTLARALSGNVEGEEDYLYVLANDADPQIRLAAVEGSRRLLAERTSTEELGPESGHAIAEIFESRLHDSVSAIRKQARRGFARAQFPSV